MIKTDYKSTASNKPIFSGSRKRKLLPVVLMTVLALILIAWGIWPEDKDSSEPNILSPQPSSIESDKVIDNDIDNNETDRQELQLDFQHDKKSKQQNRPIKKEQNSQKSKTSELEDTSLASQFSWHKSKIRSGDSMAKVFKRNGFSPTDLHTIISLGDITAVLKKVQPNQILEYSKDSKGNLQAVRYKIDNLKTLTVIKNNDQWQAEVETKKVEIRLANARGEITSSLFLAGKDAGLTDAMVMELAGIFGWDIDFILDIRQKDQFTVIFEEKYIDGEKFGNGRILAAEFVNQGKSFQAVLYTDASGRSEYYTPEGMSMRKAFLRAPVDFSYVSSKFNPRRFHPILKRVKAHNGVDYRAPKGTPVKAAGDGKVIVSAYSKYNGHHVFVQHGQKYVTKYLHFTKRKVRRGQKVKQGQIIGYVGATGLAQAPHLHYEFLVNGVHRNPRTIKLPDAKPINRKEKTQFLNKTRALVEQLKAQSLVYDQSATTAD